MNKKIILGIVMVSLMLVPTLGTCFSTEPINNSTMMDESKIEKSYTVSVGFINARFNYAHSDQVNYDGFLFIKRNVRIEGNLGFLCINGKLYDGAGSCLTIDLLIGSIRLRESPFWTCDVTGFAMGIGF